MASRLLSLRSIPALTLAASVLAACSAGDTPAEKVDSVGEAQQAFSLRSVDVVGSLDYGETSPPTRTASRQRYTAYKFGGNAGDLIDVRVTSRSGDPVTWVLDNDWHIVAKNDDASKSDTNSHLTATLPANASITHYIVVRDYYDRPMRFSVALKGKTVDFASGCDVDADCAKVEKGCCPLGNYVAVLASKADAYAASLNCEPSPMCPKIATRPNYAMAECNRSKHACELVAPAAIACGGFIAPPMQHECPAGYSCRHDGINPDLPGKCVQFCGGIAGFACHAGDEQCVDDPSDSCDPAVGGADCSGICVPKP